MAARELAVGRVELPDLELVRAALAARVAEVAPLPPPGTIGGWLMIAGGGGAIGAPETSPTSGGGATGPPPDMGGWAPNPPDMICPGTPGGGANAGGGG